MIEKFIQQTITIEKTEEFDELNLENQSLLIWLSDKDLPELKIMLNYCTQQRINAITLRFSNKENLISY